MIAVRLLAIFAYISVAHAFFGNKHTTSRLTLLSASATDTTMPEPRVGDKIPAVTLYEGLGDFEKQEVNLLELIAGKKVVIFGVPGAFTPGCSKSHLPSFIDAQDELKAKGVELTICIATNDLYVMEVCTSIFFFFILYMYDYRVYSSWLCYFSWQAWGSTSGGSAAGIRFLSDSNAELSKALGLVKENPMMPRTKRFSLVAEDGVITHYFSSAEQSSDTWAPAVLAKL